MDLEKMRAIARQPTRERRRAEAMGFTFTNVDVVWGPFDGSAYVMADFTCVCGQPERGVFALPDVDRMREHVREHVLVLELDIAARLRRSGSFSASHLRADGYTEDRIADIIARGEQFDRDNPL